MTDEKIILPYKDQQAGKKEQVASMFNSISPKYDLLNRLLSFGIDIYWRKRAIKLLQSEKPKTILDIATGTADFAIEALKLNPDKIVGVDISEGMLAIGREKLKKRNLDKKIELRLGDSEKLPFSDNSFDAVIVSFGVRNFENLERGLADMFRVTRPGGTCVILEFSKPRSFPFKQFYDFYSYRIMPLIGKTVSKDDRAYRYLPESVRAFPDGKDFTSILDKVGFRKTRSIALTFGICSIYTGKKEK
ncbi:bifunctional demethylmenaquinone methyltransferase/2-methoxy-6-polyprenyl-1,4-benzoquinol methylase UbiE [Cytophagaceae bacterium YF14B1]|uniref:Demethylmenaquinone methyltransferase n=1 Tax=Xanthocytophaga flava TaxID=3048013 RepID=A0AAE3QMJ8_9BACT|nr:bifunctional demethylmenaquinone methyltransferase/2-methoxy-6-polyprenyl-1,4-benzoquinol methylase UbiE [Xanthocytophaga flavus]MDJ1473581.1 bifunctional demethylmenaquinone methyltransferase/2-methoxy-6-polyprenyl-1,4-benzoquinol methylase UbiE [Xanthocytophaga flavus]MDJ1479393.1 bifunctional demethylmenaquinone methyltransferase/2-methoxy-6-polyprenyl-1,4-benzoquinol methylase UbiE [Xanthocytophaga flavus]